MTRKRYALKVFIPLLKGKKLNRKDISELCNYTSDPGQIIQTIKNNIHIEISVIPAINPADTVWYIKLEERQRFYTEREEQRSEQKRKLAQGKYERSIDTVKKLIKEHGSEVVENCLVEEK
ncbi:hypothetical protein [uncultured Photobacterium sp.]|uniref:hypothetical protein n=1 Tax=uncultured Photobacterium sp. TaxID=173973 RepID=UPI0026389FD2|nr:hypothetical protein [uncultured Photobacterium sp.]